MRIGINLLYLLPGVVGGTETYAAGLLHGLAQVDSRNEYVVFVNRESAAWPIPLKSNFARVICPVTAVHRGQRYGYEQTRLPALLRRQRIDLVHSLGYVGPLFAPCPAVVTMPDINFQVIGHNMPVHKRFFLKLFSIQAAKRSAAVITISHYSQNALCQAGWVHPEKIFVTHLGPRWDPVDSSDEKVDSTLKSYGAHKPYVAAFAGGSAHKNIARLLRAFALLRGRHPHQLLLIGRLPAVLGQKELPTYVTATGYVPSEHVLPLLRGAEALVLPSLYEGFGLPALEAQQVGVPLVCSNAGALTEIAGNAAVFFDPCQVEEMAESISRVLADATLRAKLQRQGLANAGKYSWERTAADTVAVYSRVGCG